MASFRLKESARVESKLSIARQNFKDTVADALVVMWRDDAKSDKTAEAFYEILEYRVKLMLVVAGLCLEGAPLQFTSILKRVTPAQLEDKEYMKSQEKALVQNRKEEVLVCLRWIEDTFMGLTWPVDDVRAAEPLQIASAEASVANQAAGHETALAVQAPEPASGSQSRSQAPVEEEKEKSEPKAEETRDAESKAEETREAQAQAEETREAEQDGEGAAEIQGHDKKKEAEEEHAEEEGQGVRVVDGNDTSAGHATKAVEDAEDMSVQKRPQSTLSWGIVGAEASSQDVLQRLLETATCKPVARWKELKTMASLDPIVTEIREALDEEELKQAAAKFDAAKILWDELRQAGKRSVNDLSSTIHKLEIETMKGRKSVLKRSLVISEAEEKKQQKVAHMNMILGAAE